ncbi:inorganic diphosphatase [Phycomyces blakesleeanus]|uniref:inorganic diphosphatase n=1 Tax=Phycomyces blakesleeanus TaxID=4837 RepID=A0ABR3BBE1_PHYBL
MSQFQSVAIGQEFTQTRRVYLEKDGQVISPFHDIPLFANGEKTVLNMIVEIPRWSNAKMEIATNEKYNPIKQDVKKGNVRFVRNCFPFNGYIWNYGAFPQTWEDPTVTHPETHARGDNDPVDVCEIGSEIGYTGQVKQVKVLGVMALLDEGETDWKILAIDVRDPMASKLNDIDDVERHLPGLVKATREWFKIYKMPDGKPANEFAFGGECKNKAFATQVIHETHEAWERLIQGVIPAKADTHTIEVTNVNVENSPYKSSKPFHKSELGQINPNDSAVKGRDDAWYYVSARL